MQVKSLLVILVGGAALVAQQPPVVTAASAQQSNLAAPAAPAPVQQQSNLVPPAVPPPPAPQKNSLVVPKIELGSEVYGTTQGSGTFFPKPSYFKHHFVNPTGNVDLRPPARLEDYVANGVLELTLNSYLELVLANNTDIEIQRVSVELQRNAILRNYGRFDPILTASFNSTRTKSPSTSALEGAQVSNILNQPARFTYTQRLMNGTEYTVGFSGSKQSSNSRLNNYNPALRADLILGFTQPLLRDRGGLTWKLPLMIARSNLRAGEHTMRDQVMQRVVTAENLFWQVIQERENLGVRVKALELASESLKRAERELELGALSPLDIFQPQAEYATAEIEFLQARYRLIQAEDQLRRQMGADLVPTIRNLPINITEPWALASEPPEIDRENAVSRAVSNREDLKALAVGTDTADLQIKQATNSMRPQLDLNGGYTSTGRGGTLIERSNIFGDDGSPTTINRIIPGGMGDALDQLFGFGFPVYSFGLTLRLPLRDRAGSANLADALVNKRLNSLRIRTLEQQIRQDVLNAVTQVESAKASVKLAVVARNLANESYKAEQRKYELGVSTIYFVLAAQQRLTSAEAALVNQSTLYRRNLTQLLQRTGELLDERGILIQ